MELAPTLFTGQKSFTDGGTEATSTNGVEVGVFRSVTGGRVRRRREATHTGGSDRNREWPPRFRAIHDPDPIRQCDRPAAQAGRRSRLRSSSAGSVPPSVNLFHPFLNKPLLHRGQKRKRRRRQEHTRARRVFEIRVRP